VFPCHSLHFCSIFTDNHVVSKLSFSICRIQRTSAMLVCVPYSQWLQSPRFFFVLLLEAESLSQWSNLYGEFILRVRLVRFQTWDRKPFILNYICDIAPNSGKIQVYFFKIVLSVCLAYFFQLLFIHSSYGTTAHSRALTSHLVRFRNNWVLRCGVIIRNTEDRKVASSSDSSTPTCPARETVPIASNRHFT